MLLKVEHKVYVGLGLVFLLLIGTGVFANRSVVKLIADSQWVVLSLEVKKSLEELQSLVNELQNNVRAYVISGTESYVTGNDALSKRIQAALSNVRKLSADSERLQGQLDVLEPLITDRIKAMDCRCGNDEYRSIAGVEG